MKNVKGKKTSLLSNYLFNLSFQIFAMFAPLITTPYISRIFIADTIGIYSYTYSLVAYFALLATLGINNYGIRETAYLRDSTTEKSHIFFEVFILKLITTSLCIIIYLTFVNLIFNKSYSLYFYIYLIYLVSHAFDISWFFQGMELFKKTVFRNAFVKIVSVICIFIFVNDKNDLVIYIWCFSIPPLIGNLSLWLLVPKYLSKVKLKTLKPFKNLKVVLELFIPLIAVEIYTIVDKTMLGALTSEMAENGYYEQAQKIIRLARTFITSLSTVMMPNIAYNFEKSSDPLVISTTIIKIFRGVWFLAIPLSIGLFGIASNFVPWFFGDGYIKVILLLRILSPVICLGGINNIIYAGILLPTRKHHIGAKIVFIGAIINMGLNLLLLPRFLSYGAALASVTAEIVIFILSIYVLRQYVSVRIILSMSVKYISAATGMILVIFIIKVLMGNGIMVTCLQLIFGSTFYVGILLITKDSFVKNTSIIIICKIKSLFTKYKGEGKYES